MSPIGESESGGGSSNWSTLFLALISLAIYIFVLRPTGNNNSTRQQQQQQQQNAVSNGNNNNTNNNNSNRRPQQQQQRRQRGGGGPNAATAAVPVRRNIGTPSSVPKLSENAIEILTDCRSGPDHLDKDQLKNVIASTKPVGTSSSTSSSSNMIGKTIGGGTFLSDGVVGWNYTCTAKATKQLTPDVAKQLRQDRAKIMSRWLTSNSATNSDSTDSKIIQPPAPKSTLVIGVSYPMIESDSVAITNVIYRLATYYSVLLMVQVQPSMATTTNTTTAESKSTDDWNDKIVDKLRKPSTTSSSSEVLLTDDILPSHRIMICQSPTGRIALVRQLGKDKVGLVVDYDASVKVELERFGYNVIIVSKSDWVSTSSALTTVKES